MQARARGMALLGALVLAGAAGAARADDAKTPLRRVSFRVESGRDVANDWLRASLAVTDEDADPAALADRINRAMEWGLARAKQEKRVRVQSGGYDTQPVYEDGRIRRWRASQQLWVEGADFDAITRLLGDLQARLQLQSLAFSVSPEQRRKVEDALIEEALGAFKARADLVRRNLGASGYAIVQLDIDTQGEMPPPRPMPMRAMAAEAKAAPPALEGGTSRVTVGVSATIELD
jgi:predicted secreted protein